MNAKTRRMIKVRFISSYKNGISKSMDANNEIRVFHRVKKSTVYGAWEDVGKDLTDIMAKYDEQAKASAHG